MIVNTMIGKSGGGGDVTVQATELTIDDSNVVHIKFPGLPAGATIKNLNLSRVSAATSRYYINDPDGSQVGSAADSIVHWASMRSSGAVEFQILFYLNNDFDYVDAHAKWFRKTITVGDGEITFAMPTFTPELVDEYANAGYTLTWSWTLEMPSSKLWFITYSA